MIFIFKKNNKIIYIKIKMFNQNFMPMPMMQFPTQNQNDIKREEIIKPYKEIISQLEKEIEQLRKKNEELLNQLKQYQMNLGNNGMMGNQMNLMNNIGSMGMIGNQINSMNNMMNPMNNMGNVGMMNNQFLPNNMMNPINNMGNIGMMNIQFPPNNMKNPMNNIMNSPMYQMCNQMNLDDNKIIQMKNNKEVKFLSIRVKMEDNVQIYIQTKSDEKMENAINKFCNKVVINKKEDYDFFVISGPKRAKFKATVEENGIEENDDYILVKKKLNINQNSNEINSNNAQIEKNVKNMHEINPIIKGDIINLLFICSSGLNIPIQIGLKNTFRDAEMLFFNKVGIPFSRYKDVIFLFGSQKIDENKTIEHLFVNGSHITVLDQNSIIGA